MIALFVATFGCQKAIQNYGYPLGWLATAKEQLQQKKHQQQTVKWRWRNPPLSPETIQQKHLDGPPKKWEDRIQGLRLPSSRLWGRCSSSPARTSWLQLEAVRKISFIWLWRNPSFMGKSLDELCMTMFIIIFNKYVKKYRRVPIILLHLHLYHPLGRGEWHLPESTPPRLCPRMVISWFTNLICYRYVIYLP